MRLFTALSLPEPIAYSLEAFLRPLRGLASIRWSPTANMHITTRFIGEWPEEQLAPLLAALHSIGCPAFDVQVAGLGWFPSPQSPHVFWMGVDGGDALRQLAAETDNALARLSSPPEDRPYTPHLTLARMRRESRLANLRRVVDTLAPPALPLFTATDFHLYRSESGVYRKLESFHLVRSIKCS